MNNFSDTSNIEISIVSPVYMAEDYIEKLVEEILIGCSFTNKRYEIILVEDGSSDDTWGKIKKICNQNKIVRGLKLSRNFGQHLAIRAGLNEARGSWIVVMDCDLQDNPHEIKNLYQKAKEGYFIVRARRINRRDNIFKKSSSKIFYKLLEYFTNIEQDSTIANFGIYHRKVINSIKKIKDTSPFFPSQVKWVGFRKYDLNIYHGKRISKKSNYSFKKLLNLAINNILLFSDKPLILTVKFGFLMSLFSFIMAIIYLIMALSTTITVSGFASIIITLFISTGMIIFSVGVIGLYIGKIFESSKNRPHYVVEDLLN